MCLESNRQMARRSTQSGIAHGFSLIPVSGVGVVVNGVKIGGNGISGIFKRDMIKDEMTFWTESSGP